MKSSRTVVVSECGLIKALIQTSRSLDSPSIRSPPLRKKKSLFSQQIIAAGTPSPSSTTPSRNLVGKFQVPRKREVPTEVGRGGLLRTSTEVSEVVQGGGGPYLHPRTASCTILPGLSHCRRKESRVSLHQRNETTGENYGLDFNPPVAKMCLDSALSHCNGGRPNMVVR